MKRIILLLHLSSIVFSEDASFKQILENLTDPISKVQVRTLYFLQELDHFNPENKMKFRQRYRVSATYYRKSGPAFLFIRGTEVTNFREIRFPSPWLAYAKEVNAICFSLDHRFYGEGWPANATLTYLSSRQALADIENFIKSMNKEFKFKNTNWITFGCSYGGMLSAWARLKYPRLIHGAVATGSPLLATADFYQYAEIVEQSIKAYNPKCIESFSSAVEEIVDYIKMNKTIKIDRNFSTNWTWSEIINFAWNWRPEYMEPMDVLNEIISILNCVVLRNQISTVCDTIIKYEGSKVHAYFELDKMFLGCQADRATMELRNYVDNPKVRKKDGWRYQRCSEFGFIPSYYKTAYLSAAAHLLPPYETGVKTVCDPFFGSNFSLKVLQENVNRTNLFYGGLGINIENMLFIHGSLDPWHTLGHYKKTNGSLYETIFIEGTSHCSDINPASDEDIPELKAARKKILEVLKIWLEKKST